MNKLILLLMIMFSIYELSAQVKITNTNIYNTAEQMFLANEINESGDPNLPQVIDPDKFAWADFSTLRWDRSKMDKTLNPAAMGQSLMKHDHNRQCRIYYRCFKQPDW